MNLCDLHIHSHYSTGSQSLEELLQEAKSKGIELISVTDDDTMEAYQELPELAAKHGMAYLTGAQVTTALDGHFLRFLAYGCDPDDGPLKDLLQKNHTQMSLLGELIVAALSELYPQLSLPAYRAHKRDQTFGGFKYNSYLRSAGLAGDFEGGSKLMAPFRDEFPRMLREVTFSTLQEAITAIHAAGARSSCPAATSLIWRRSTRRLMCTISMVSRPMAPTTMPKCRRP